MTRRAWIYVTTGYVLMAVGFLIVLFILNSHIQTVKQTQRQLATVAVHNAGAICLIATAPTQAEEREIVEAFLRGDGTVVRLFTPMCARVASKAAHDIFGGGRLPDDLEEELERAIHNGNGKGVG